jgi:two-component system chemotaxis response regulator CheY
MNLRSPTPDSARKYILVVDDDEDLRDAMALVLSPSYGVRVAVDGMDGYTKAHDQPHPDLIIADVSMPGLDGISMVRRIRESDALRRVPVIFFTGQMSPESVEVGLSVGSFAYLSKACASGELEDTVRRALRIRAQRRGAP